MSARSLCSSPRDGALSRTILRSTSSDIRLVRRWAGLSAVQPPNTRRKSPVSTAATAANALMTYQSFSTSAGPGRPKCSWTSSSCSRVGLSLKDKLRISVAEMAREAALHSYDRVDRHLRRTTLVVGAFGFRRLPFNAELVERLACDTGEALGTVQHRVPVPARDNRPRPTTAAKPRQAP